MEKEELEDRIEDARRRGIKNDPYYAEAVVALADELAAEREKVRNLEAALSNAQPIGEKVHEVHTKPATGDARLPAVRITHKIKDCPDSPMTVTRSKLHLGPDGRATCEMALAETKQDVQDAINYAPPVIAAMQDAERQAREHSIQFPGPEGIESLAQNQVDPPPEVTEFVDRNFWELVDTPANPGPGVDECISMQGAPTQAEVDALRAEVERLREERDEAVNDVGEWCECVHEAGELLGVRPGDEVRPGVLAKIRELIEDRERITMDRNNLVVMYNTAHATADEAIKQRDEARRCSCEELRNTRLANTIIREERDEERAEVERAQNLLLAVILRISPAEVDNREFFGCSYTDSDIEDLGAYEYLASVGKLTRHKVAKDGWMRTVDPDAVMKEAWDCAAMREHIETLEAEVDRLKANTQNGPLPPPSTYEMELEAEVERLTKERDEARAERDKACNELTTTIKQYDEDERSRQQQYAYQYDCQRAEIDNLRERLKAESVGGES